MLIKLSLQCERGLINECAYYCLDTWPWVRSKSHLIGKRFFPVPQKSFPEDNGRLRLHEESFWTLLSTRCTVSQDFHNLSLRINIHSSLHHHTISTSFSLVRR